MAPARPQEAGDAPTGNKPFPSSWDADLSPQASFKHSRSLGSLILHYEYDDYYGPIPVAHPRNQSRRKDVMLSRSRRRRHQEVRQRDASSTLFTSSFVSTSSSLSAAATSTQTETTIVIPTAVVAPALGPHGPPEYAVTFPLQQSIPLASGGGQQLPAAAVAHLPSGVPPAEVAFGLTVTVCGIIFVVSSAHLVHDLWKNRWRKTVKVPEWLLWGKMRRHRTDGACAFEMTDGKRISYDNVAWMATTGCNDHESDHTHPGRDLDSSGRSSMAKDLPETPELATGSVSSTTGVLDFTPEMDIAQSIGMALQLGDLGGATCDSPSRLGTVAPSGSDQEEMDHEDKDNVHTILSLDAAIESVGKRESMANVRKSRIRQGSDASAKTQETMSTTVPLEAFEDMSESTATSASMASLSSELAASTSGDEVKSEVEDVEISRATRLETKSVEVKRVVLSMTMPSFIHSDAWRGSAHFADEAQPTDEEQDLADGVVHEDESYLTIASVNLDDFPIPPSRTM